jgi:hypothetical protein
MEGKTGLLLHTSELKTLMAVIDSGPNSSHRSYLSNRSFSFLYVPLHSYLYMLMCVVRKPAAPLWDLAG